MNTILPSSNQDSPGAIMFHHFLGSIFNLSPGSISASDLERLLEIDDTNLFNFYNGLDTDIKFKNNKINSLFKNYKY